MYHAYCMCPYHPNVYWGNGPMYPYRYIPAPGYWGVPNEVSVENPLWEYPDDRDNENSTLRDHGKNPFVVDINRASKQNNTFRTAIWTGEHLQVTLMSIDVGDDIGLEIHHDTDQFLRIEEGQGLVQMGKNKNQLDFVRRVGDDSAIMVPAGTWHNLTNMGNTSLKLYSIYAPPEHPFGTVHRTKAEAEAAEKDHG